MTENTTDATEPAADTDEAAQPQEQLDAADQDSTTEQDADQEEQPKRGVRQRLAEAETERDQLRAALAAANQTLFELAAERAHVEPSLMAARGLQPSHYTDETGVADLAAMVAAMTEQRAELGLPARPQPNPVAGRTTGGTGGGTATFADVLREHVRGGVG